MYSIQKNYTTVNGVSLFYRSVGEGPFIFLLHPSPRSSAMMEPFMQLLAKQYTVIAPDTPGYGLSTAANKTIESVYDYTYFIEALQEHLNAPVISLYGSASGAQLAIGYALSYPQKINRLFIDNAAHFEDAVRTTILQHYFIDITPTEDGSHLINLWNHVRQSCLFFPWYDERAENQIAQALPPVGVLQNIVNDYLLAGPNYALAYRAAFNHEKAEKVQALQVPTIIFRWLGSPILKHIDALLLHPMPNNITVIETPAAMADRFVVMEQVMGGTK